MGNNWTEEQYQAHMAKMNPLPPDAAEIPDEGPEKVLQAKCMQYCKDKGYPVFHDRSKKVNDPGFPDLFIFAEKRVVLIELKAESGKLRKEQEHLRRVLKWLGHTVHICRSYAGFVRIMIGDSK